MYTERANLRQVVIAGKPRFCNTAGYNSRFYKIALNFINILLGLDPLPQSFKINQTSLTSDMELRPKSMT